ncbi:RHS repeat protein, partial [Akkermansia muciniphila]
MSKHSSCLIHRNFLVGISYSDATPGQSFAYDHLGQLTQITDAAGTRTFA